MDMEFVSAVVLPIVYVIVGIALVWALVELVLFLRRLGKTVSSVEEQVTPILADAKEMTESLKPAVDKVDPLVERVSLAVDAANLEIMRLDGILGDVGDITQTASQAVSAVDTVAQTPMRIVNDVSEKLRGAFKGKKASDESVALGTAGESAASGLATPAAEPQVAAAEPEPVASAPAAPAPAEAAPAADESVGEEAPKQGGYFTY